LVREWQGGGMTIDRRTLLAASLALPAVPAMAAAEPADTIDLWPGEAPGLTNPALRETVVERGTGGVRDRALTGIRRPRLDVFRPAQPNGAAVLITPGGGYARVVVDKEGQEIARWLAERGITAFVLYYRLPAEGWRDPANTPLADAQRAMRLIRARATTYGVDPARVGAIGFSAGGHLCADLAVRHARRVYDQIDDADRLDARPALAAPVYPVVSMDPSIAHAGSRTNLLGANPIAAAMVEHSPDRQMTKATPPLFIVHAQDDATVPFANAVALQAAARTAGVPAELHLFERGGHGFGWGRRTAGLPVHLWPDLWFAWARTHALLG
jgi:acetyl esterase/lipase